MMVLIRALVVWCLFSGGTAVFIDAEHALDAAYARAIGVDMDSLYLAQPDNGEQGTERRAIPIHVGAVFLVNALGI